MANRACRLKKRDCEIAAGRWSQGENIEHSTAFCRIQTST